ncbi:hypothetical protein T09_2260 [Trichinella sp. T9]|nr:hypothetical protein T09_2260 [Trichinella sp. T9]
MNPLPAVSLKTGIPRCLILPPVEETNSIELHVYGDASKWAYGTVAYLKVISKDKTTSSSLEDDHPSTVRAYGSFNCCQVSWLH